MTLEPGAARYIELAGLYAAAMHALEQATRWAQDLVRSEAKGDDFGAQFVAYASEVVRTQGLVEGFLDSAAELGELAPSDLIAAAEQLARASGAASARAEAELRALKRAPRTPYPQSDLSQSKRTI